MGEDQDNKRAREEEPHTDGGANDAGPTKKSRTDDGAGTEGGGKTINGNTSSPVDASSAPEAGTMESAESDGKDAQEEGKPEESKPADEPKKIGYKTFKDGKEAANYYRTLLNALTLRQNLNEYEHHMALELLKMGHPEPERKIGSGVQRIQIRKHQTEESNCFFIIRTDGTIDDFSVYKCINKLFPSYGESRGLPDSSKGRGRGRGRGGRGRGRGGRKGARGG